MRAVIHVINLRVVLLGFPAVGVPSRDSLLGTTLVGLPLCGVYTFYIRNIPGGASLAGFPSWNNPRGAGRLWPAYYFQFRGASPIIVSFGGGRLAIIQI